MVTPQQDRAPTSEHSTATDTATDAEQSGPLLRSPWFWGFVLGVVFLTAIRPVMRRIPEPPAVGALLTPFNARHATTDATVAWGDDTLWDATSHGVQAYTVWTPSCGEPCMRAIRVLRRAEGHLARRDIEIHPVTIMTATEDSDALPAELIAQSAGASSWNWLQVPEDSYVFANLDSHGGATSRRTPSSIASEGYVWIVTRTGHVSGKYSTHADDAIDELSARLTTVWSTE